MNIDIKRVYDKPDPKDGLRVLVDRLWPRGLTKEAARVDVWLKALAPSTELRQWYQHDAQKWPEFKARYYAELGANSEAVSELLGYVKKGRLTLLFSTKEPQLNNALALKEYMTTLVGTEDKTHERP